MTKPRVCVLRAPGTNCDEETAFAFESAGAIAQRLHLSRLLEAPHQLSDYQILCIPGGFSYGDDVGAGVIFAQKLQNRLSRILGDFLHRDALLLGICNGFQVLLKSGLLPDGSEHWPPRHDAQRPATLTWNNNGQYTALWVNLKVAAPHNVFLKGIDQIAMPLAHAEGRLVVRKPDVLAAWKERGQIAMQYCRPDKNDTTNDELLPYPLNPNGSIANIAGLSDPTGRVLGLMPHPERFIHATQHPQWTRLRLSGDGNGLRLFRNAVSYFS